jgi:hypothetical protein
MPRYVSELAQGNSFSRSSDNGAAADRATRKFKVLLNSANESWDVFAAIGVNIGDLYSANAPIPCVSVEAVHDGESRLVCIVTAEYRSSAAAGPGAADPKSQQPTVRPAMYSMTTSLTEIAAWGGAVVTGTSSGAWQPAVNPVGDLVDGVTRLEPVVNINIEQYAIVDKTNIMAYVGYVNSDSITFSGLTIYPHCCMFQSLNVTPVVENFNGAIFRGFKVTLGFAVRAHWTITRNGFQAIGWDQAVPITGFNIRNSGLGRADVDQKALCLEHKDFKVELDGGGNPKSLAKGTANAKVRGSVTVAATSSEDGGYIQRPCAQPIALNDDGTPRNIDAFSAAQKVLINRVCLQPEMAFGNNFSNFGISVYNIT